MNRENSIYFGFGIISRFRSKYSSTILCTVNAPDSVLMSQALLSPAGEISVFILNKSNEEQVVSLKIDNLPVKTLSIYQVTKETVSKPDFKLNSIQSFDSYITGKLILPPQSITTVSGFSLEHTDNGINLK